MTCQKKYSRMHIGEIFMSDKGYKIEIINGGSREGYCTVYIDNMYETEVKYIHAKRGDIKNLFHPSVYGVGYLGAGNYTRKDIQGTTKAYVIWAGMIQRAYDPELHKRLPSYKDVTVCEDWHNFQNFAKWFEENYIEGYELDKDLLSGDKKIYSEGTCLFIPNGLNVFLPKKYSTNKSGHCGVCWVDARSSWSAYARDGNGNKINIGLFKDKQEAIVAHNKQRAIYAKEWRNKMKGILPQEAIERIK